MRVCINVASTRMTSNHCPFISSNNQTDENKIPIHSVHPNSRSVCLYCIRGVSVCIHAVDQLSECWSCKINTKWLDNLYEEWKGNSWWTMHRIQMSEIHIFALSFILKANTNECCVDQLFASNAKITPNSVRLSCGYFSFIARVRVWFLVCGNRLHAYEWSPLFRNG